MVQSILLTPTDLARLLRITERTLERWRLTGYGPSYIKLSNHKAALVAYNRSAVLEWLRNLESAYEAGLPSCNQGNQL